MTYYYKIKGTLVRKEGGEPPKVDEFVAIGKDDVVRHFKDGNIIEEEKIEFPIVPKEAADPALRELYKSGAGLKITKDMLYPKYRKKTTSRKKVHRKCKCK